MKDELKVLENYKDGAVVRSEDRYILEKYRQIGLVKYGMKFGRTGQGEKAKLNPTPTASLTSLGRRYLYEKKAENSFMGKLFQRLPF